MDNEDNTTTAISDISEQKLIANQLNAQKSTGPKTAAGKDKSKMNALKHGLRSDQVVVPALGGGETEAAYNELLGQFREQLSPQGILEDMLVEEIAVCYWRRKRVVRCEAGEIRGQIEELQRAEAEQRERVIRFCTDEELHSDESKYQMKQSSVGIKHLISIYQEVKESFETEGSGDRLWLEWLKSELGEDNRIVVACTYLANEASHAPSEPERVPGHPARRSRKQLESEIISLLDGCRKELEELLKEVEEREQRERDAKISSLALPSVEVNGRILRYETAIDRKMYRAIDELQRLQKQRKGEPVLPRINVDITGQN